MALKRVLGVLLSLVLVIALAAGCGQSEDQTTPSEPKAEKTALVVGATPVPHGDILKVVKPLLEKEGIDLQIKEFTDYVTPNLALNDKQLDANYFQHAPYLEDFCKQHSIDLTWTAKIHFEPMGLYSKKVKDVNEFAEGATIGVPNDPTNGGRALVVLEKAGLLTLKEGVGIAATVQDITEKKVEIKELEAAMLPKVLDEVDGAVINGNYAVQAGLKASDAMIAEDAQSEAADTYGNILTVRKGDENRPEIEALTKALQSPEVKKFIEETYQGAVIPTF